FRPLRRTRPVACPCRPLAASRSAKVLARRRVFRILRQIVGDLEPRRLAADEDVACRPHPWIVENGQRDAVLRQCAGELGGAFPVRSRPVDDRGAAFAAEPAQVAAGALVRSGARPAATGSLRPAPERGYGTARHAACDIANNGSSTGLIAAR